ncbi:S-methyl thiohydantoin desulfurase domain-containing protein [Streptomyces sp. NPDC001478]
MKRQLTHDDLRAAVYGGAVLGGGGGGFVERGLRTAELALQVGTPELWTADEFAADDLTATVALVGAPAAPDPQVLPTHLLRALELLRRELPRELVAVHTNENGAETTINGWFHSAMTGLPVIDLACNGRAHPSSVMGAMGLHHEDGYRSSQGYAGGKPHSYVEGAVSGGLEATSNVVRRASVEAGGWVGVARNPVEVGYAVRNGAPGAIGFAIELGRRFLADGPAGAAAQLGGEIAVTGTVRTYRCAQREGLDVGVAVLDDAAGTTLHFVNEYMALDVDGERRASFPDLITTFDEDGQPLASADVAVGTRLSVLVAPADNLLLSTTMYMPEVYAPVEELLGVHFAPEARALSRV